MVSAEEVGAASEAWWLKGLLMMRLRIRRDDCSVYVEGVFSPVQAAGVIHTDFEEGFIKAEVISFDDLVDAGSVVEARAKGKARLEGKDYVMRDGDVVEFRFNV